MRETLGIVPLYRPEEIKIASGLKPKLIYHGGPLLEKVEVVTVFTDKSWQNQINKFFQFILQSPLINQLKEYSVPDYKIGYGRLSKTIIAPELAKLPILTDNKIQKLPFLKPDPSKLYFIFLPPAVKVTKGNGSSCQTFCGYHDSIRDQVFYAVLPFPNCPGCLGKLTVFDALTVTCSHELCEAITDPVPGSGWYDPKYGEIGDICAWKTKKLGQYTIQLEWSNKLQSCI